MATRRIVEWALGAAFVAAVAGALWWAESPTLADDASLGVGNVLFGTGFALTAAFLATAREQRGNAALMALAAVAFVIDESSQQAIGEWSARVSAAGPFVQVLTGAILLRYPEPRFDRPSRIFIATNAALAVAIGTALALRYPIGYPYADSVPSEQFERVLTIRAAWWAAGSCVFVVLLVRRWRRLQYFDRRVLRPVALAAATGAAAIALAPIQRWLPPQVGEALDLARSWVAVLISMSFVVSAALLRLSLIRVATLAARLEGPISVTEVESALQEAIGDDSLRVYYWLPASASYVDGTGSVKPDQSSGDSAIVSVQASSGDPLAVIIASSGVRRHQALLQSAAAVSRLALESTHLEAQLRFQLSETRQARSRLLRAGWEQRRQIERDLHDGAQQHLLAVALRLGAVEAQAGSALIEDGIREARGELTAALAELRELAHGIYPAALSQSGLAAAVEAVAERLAVPIVLKIPDRRWSPDTESAAYFLVCEAFTNATKHAEAQMIWVTVTESGSELVVSIRDDGKGNPELNDRSALPGLRDRLGALGGTLSVESAPTGTTVVGSIPCG